MKKAPLKLKLRSGAALMLALWALFLLSAMVISWAFDINSRLAVSGNANRVLEAEAMAFSGAEVALALPSNSSSSPNLHAKIDAGESYDVQITGECGRLNLNLLIPGGQENQTYVEILRRYLALKGVELNDRDRMVDSLLDWISPTRGLHRLNACPETDDYRPPHIGRLDSVDELKKVCGWEEFTSKPHWNEDFTVLIGGCQQISLAWASRDVLRALQIGDDKVDRFLQLRSGSDGIDGTSDDFQFGATTQGTKGKKTGGGMPAEVQTTLGLTPEWLSKYQNLITFESPVLRIVSTGKSRDVTRSVEMLVVKQGNNPKVLAWKEL
jgi:general secretion pathway protein K